MPSNKELAAEATKLAAGLDIEVDTDGLNNNKLSELVSDLKAKKRDAETNVPLAVESPPVQPSVKLPPYSIAQGKAITCKKGILEEGDEVKADYLHGGDDTLKALVKSGHVVKA